MAEEKAKPMTLTEEQIIQIARQEEQSARLKKEEMQNYLELVRESNKTKETLNEMKTTNGKVLINIGATIMIEVEAKQIKKCKRGFAGNVYVDEDIDETIKWLTTKENEFNVRFEKAKKEYAETEAKLTKYINILKQVEAEKVKHAQKKAKAPPTLSK